MSKRHVNITLDQDVWLYWTMKKENVSGLINNILKQMMKTRTENKTVRELEDQIKKQQENIDQAQKQLIELSTNLVMAVKEEEKQEEEHNEVVDAMHKTIVASGELTELI